MRVVILCGGKGTRLREETEYRPKPMLPIGNRPILWHIMKIYASHGHTSFILCLGYKGKMIKDYFRDYEWSMGDVTVWLGRKGEAVFHDNHGEEDWVVTLAETGEESMTGYRVKQIEKHLEDDAHFLLTYGDGVADVDINRAVAFHHGKGAACTLTGVHPSGRFGELRVDAEDNVTAFNEKPQAEGGYINGGFMVCSREIFRYLPDDPGVMLERAPMDSMIRDNKLAVFRHEGFWQPMDTYQEFLLLNRLWQEGKAPWKTWT